MNRVKWLDFLRAAAILLVILCHCTENVYYMDISAIQLLSVYSKTFCISSFSLGRLSVPLFLMITGALLLNRDYDDEMVKKFYRRNLLNIVVCSVIWFSAYQLYDILCNNAAISPGQFIEGIFFVRRIRMPQGWYLPAIIGIYLLVPFVAHVIRSFDQKVFILPLIVITAYAFCFSLLCIIHGVHNPNSQLISQFPIGSVMFCYLLYVVYGYFIYKGILKKAKTVLVAVIAVLSFVLLVLLQYWSFSNGYNYKLWYDDIFVLISSGCIFELESRLKNVPCYKAVRFLSKYSFAIYLIHQFFVWQLKSTIWSIPVSNPIMVIIYTVVISAISIIAAYILGKIPKIGNYILHIK